MENLICNHYKFTNLDNLNIDFLDNIKTNAYAFAVGNFLTMHKNNIDFIENFVKDCSDKKLDAIIITLNSNEIDELFFTNEEKFYMVKHLNIKKFISCEFEIVPKLEDFIHCIKDIYTPDLLVKEQTDILSDTIIKYFENLDFPKIKQFLGFSYPIIGVIEKGKGLGRTVGMPTANLRVSDCKLRPPNGVYATTCYIRGRMHIGLTNIGKRPTVDNDDRITIETFIMDFDEDIYGETMVLLIDFYIRGVEKFSSLEEVKNQVSKDIEVAKKFYISNE